MLKCGPLVSGLLLMLGVSDPWNISFHVKCSGIGIGFGFGMCCWVIRVNILA